MKQVEPTTQAWLRGIGASTEMGAMVADFDWSRTQLGPPSEWSIGLRMAVGICLTSSFPMLVVWGPDLVKVYNDGYRSLLGRDKHPRALGAAARDVWPEIWHEIGPMFDAVLATGQPTWMEQGRLMIERNGFLEECFFTWSYSPLFDDDGSIGGVLDVVHEVTEQVVAQRRLACLSSLGSALVDAEHVTDVCVLAANALSEWSADLRSVEMYLTVGDDLLRIAANTRVDSLLSDHQLLLRASEQRVEIVVGDPVGGTLPAERLVAPIGGSLGGVDGVLVASLSPNRPYDDGYATFLGLVTNAIGAALDNAYRRAIEVGEYRHVSETLQRSMLSPISNQPTLAARYLPAIGNLSVGGDWYDVIDLGPRRRAIVVGDCVGHGLDAATVMAQLRSAARAMLLDGRDPAATLGGLDAFAASTDGAFCASVVCAIVDRNEGHVVYSRAGHPPPLLVSSDADTMWLDGGSGPLLAVGRRQVRTNCVQPLRGPEDMIVMYTDGLVERRGEDLEIGLERLATAARQLAAKPIGEIADDLLGILLPETTRDDVVIVIEQGER